MIEVSEADIAHIASRGLIIAGPGPSNDSKCTERDTMIKYGGKAKYMRNIHSRSKVSDGMRHFTYPQIVPTKLHLIRYVGDLCYLVY